MAVSVLGKSHSHVKSESELIYTVEGLFLVFSFLVVSFYVGTPQNRYLSSAKL